jgi:glucose-1-phosphate cytidylyltransferase
MKTIILCGGRGTRLYPDTELKPKPLVQIGEYPVLWHIMKTYSSYGYKDFVLALGYKGESIKDYFLNYHLRSGNVKINLGSGQTDYENGHDEDWQIDLVNTGLDTLTGGRLARLKPLLKDNGTFMLTYGDGVANIDIGKLIEFHKSHNKIATVSAVHPIGRFGVMEFDGNKVTDFHEKPQANEGWINGGYFIFETEIFDYLKSDKTILERDPMERLAKDGQLMAFKHDGFWHCMDTPRDRDDLNELWSSGNSPWKTW